MLLIFKNMKNPKYALCNEFSVERCCCGFNCFGNVEQISFKNMKLQTIMHNSVNIKVTKYQCAQQYMKLACISWTS